MATLVYQYGLPFGPTSGTRDVFETAMRDTHRVYNDMIAAEIAKRKAIDVLDGPVVAQARAQVDDAYERIAALRADLKQMRGNKPEGSGRPAHDEEVASLKDRIAEGKAGTRPLINALREAKKIRRAEPDWKPAAAEIDKANSGPSCAAAGIYWGLYQQARESADAAIRMSRPAPPRCKRWTGEGTIHAQVMHGGSIDAVVGGGHTVVQIDPVDPGAWDPATSRGQRRRLQRTMLRVRVGSAAHRPVWAEFPMVMHRPLQTGSRVTHVRVTRTMVADRPFYTAQMTLDVAATPPVPVDPLRFVAIDWGWRIRHNVPCEGLCDGDLRVAYWVDGAGQHGEFRVPVSVPGRMCMADAKRGHRDECLDNLRAALRVDLGDRSRLSPELREATEHMHQWKAPRKFVILLRRHGEAMPPAARERLTVWYHHDRHHWQAEAGVRRHAIGCRNDTFGRWAADLAERYDGVFIEDLEVSRMAKKPEPEAREDVDDDAAERENKAARQRVVCAPATFRAKMEQAMHKHGKRAIGVGAKDTTRVCSQCGCVHPPRGPELMQTCEACGQILDQDHNAALNVMSLGLSILASDPDAGLPPPPKPARFAKRHHKSEQTVGDAPVV